MSKTDFIKTAQAEEAFAMCKTVMDARQYSRIGQITGEPGTGKSTLTKWLADELGGERHERDLRCGAGHRIAHL